MNATVMTTCSGCGNAVPHRGLYCPICGAGLPKAAGGGDPLVGLILDQKYRLIAKIGEGGMAKVYRAEHVFLREHRAVKLIKGGGRRLSIQMRRFNREARLARKVCEQTRHVVRIDDFGFHPGVGYYYSMELLEGRSLREELRKPPRHLSPRTAVRIAAQVCEGMEIAHREGTIHRDLKPDNIYLIDFDGNPDFVKLLDFGLAKPLVTDETSFTELGKVVGTPEYMSPEQCRGPTPQQRAAGIPHLDGRSDVYSLGVVMFQCVTGKVPFALKGGQNPADLLALMSRHLTEKPPRPSVIRPSVPKELEAVVLKCMVKNPAERFQSMSELHGVCLRLLGEKPRPLVPQKPLPPSGAGAAPVPAPGYPAPRGPAPGQQAPPARSAGVPPPKPRSVPPAPARISRPTGGGGSVPPPAPRGGGAQRRPGPPPPAPRNADKEVDDVLELLDVVDSMDNAPTARKDDSDDDDFRIDIARKIE